MAQRLCENLRPSLAMDSKNWGLNQETQVNRQSQSKGNKEQFNLIRGHFVKKALMPAGFEKWDFCKMQLEIQGGGDLPDFFLLLTLRLPCLVRGRSHARAEGYQKLGRSSTTTMRLGSADHV